MQQSENKTIRILAIESSCDETAASVVEEIDGKPVVISNVISSQIDLHAKTGGVVPEVASRAHMEAINPVIALALLEAKNTQSADNFENADLNIGAESYQEAIKLFANITHIAVTAGPGLVGSLLVGFNAAKTLVYTQKLPIIAVNHIEGHIYSGLVNLSSDKIKFPLLALTVSGGHTSLTLMSDHGEYHQLGQTLDDAVGEAYDKVAKLLNLGYPGGPIISKYAQESRNEFSNLEIRQSENDQINVAIKQSSNLAIDRHSIIFPRPIINDSSLNFSFSGLKTAVLQEVINLRKETTVDLTLSQKQEIAAAFEEAVAEVLCTKTRRAIENHQPKSVIFAGGVSANPYLVSRLKKMIDESDDEITFLTPERKMTGDNAAMIGIAAYYHIQNNEISEWDEIKVDSNWELVQ